MRRPVDFLLSHKWLSLVIFLFFLVVSAVVDVRTKTEPPCYQLPEPRGYTAEILYRGFKERGDPASYAEGYLFSTSVCQKRTFHFFIPADTPFMVMFRGGVSAEVEGAKEGADTKFVTFPAKPEDREVVIQVKPDGRSAWEYGQLVSFSFEYEVHSSNNPPHLMLDLEYR